MPYRTNYANAKAKKCRDACGRHSNHYLFKDESKKLAGPFKGKKKALYTYWLVDKPMQIESRNS